VDKSAHGCVSSRLCRALKWRMNDGIGFSSRSSDVQSRLRCTGLLGATRTREAQSRQGVGDMWMICRLVHASDQIWHALE